MKKRSIYFASIFTIFCVLLTVKAQAYDDSTYGDLFYSEYNNQIEITDCVQGATYITIPETIDGLPVTTIAENAFSGCTDLESIFIPDSVKNIGTRAFLDCKALNEIRISSNSDKYKISDEVLFSKDGKSLLLAPRNISGTYTIPNGVETIGSTAFDCCNKLTSLEFPQGIRYIEPCAFSECTAITELYIPFERGYEIWNDDGTGTIYPSYIGEAAFWGCTSLKTVSLPITYSYFESGNFYIERKAFQSCTNLQKVYIPSATTVIYDNSFSDCPKLRNVCYEGSEDEWSYKDWKDYECFAKTTISFNHPAYTSVNSGSYTLAIKKSGDYASVTINSNEQLPGAQTLIMARYDAHGVLLGYETYVVGSEFDGGSCGIPIDGAACVKAFVWNNLSSMTPASNAARLEI